EHRVDAHANPEIRPHPREGGNLSEVSRLLLVCLTSRPGRLTAAARHPRPPAHELTVFRRLRSLRDADALHAWGRTIAVRAAVRAARAPTGASLLCSTNECGMAGPSVPAGHFAPPPRGL